jgi:mannose-6-phosphate isomerase-like protein (cupin superfamily)
MRGFVGPIDRMTADNGDFHRVLFTAGQMQLLLLALRRDDTIGSRTQASHDQFFRIVTGKGQIRIGAAKIRVAAGDAVVVPAGMDYTLTNTGKKRLRLYALNAPTHPPGRLLAHEKTAEPAPKRASVGTGAVPPRKGMISKGSPAAGTGP